MNLFNRKTLKRHIKSAPIPPDHLAALDAWADMIGSGQVYTLKETALHGELTSKIIEGVLGYHGPAGGADYTVATEQAILQGSVDLALGRFGGKTPEILAPFELKGAKTKDLDAIMPGRNKTPVQQAWEYAMNARGVKWVLVSNMIELRLYGFGEGTTAYETFQLDRLTDPDEYARFMLLLSADSLLSGRTLDLLKQSRAEDRDITDSLYQDYKALRLKLIGAVQTADPTIAPLDSIAVAQKILDRVLFIAFAEDTGLLPDNTLKHAFEHADPYNPHPIWDNFKGLFRAIDQGRPEKRDSAGKVIIQPIPRYNGGLFRQDDTINALVLPDDVCEGFKTLGDYDFASEVSVTVLGHIFEQSIADVERLQAQARGEDTEDEKATGTSGRRKRDGVVYNLRVGDSLIEDSSFAYLDHAFTWETAFPSVFAEGGFDVVLGNPPYVRMEFLKAMKPYLEKRYEVVSDRADLYCYFFERGLRLLKPGGRLGFISSNTFFKTGSGKPLRDYLRREATVDPANCPDPPHSRYLPT